MRFETLVAAVSDMPAFETGFLLAGNVDANDVRRQLSRWVASGKVTQFRRGLYALAPPWQHVRPHPFLIANRLVRGSYVSLHSALAFHGLIPEAVFTVTSVTHRRGGTFDTPLGAFIFHNVKREFFTGYEAREIVGQMVHVATPDKALADLIHITSGADDATYLTELRLANLDRLDVERFEAWAASSARVRRALPHVLALVTAEHEFEPI